MSKLYLFVLSNKNQASSTKMMLIAGNSYNIGSDYNNDLVMTSSGVSQRHLTIRFDRNISIEIIGKTAINGIMHEGGGDMQYTLDQVISIGDTHFIITANSKIKSNIKIPEAQQVKNVRVKGAIKRISRLKSSILIAIFYITLFPDSISHVTNPPLLIITEKICNISRAIKNRVITYLYPKQYIEYIPQKISNQVLSNIIQGYLFALGIEKYVKYDINANNTAKIYGIIFDNITIDALKKNLLRYNIRYELRLPNEILDEAASIAGFLQLNDLTFQYQRYHQIIIKGQLKYEQDKQTLFDGFKSIFPWMSVVDRITFKERISKKKLPPDAVMDIASVDASAKMPYIILRDGTRLMEGGMLDNGFLIKKIYKTRIIMSYNDEIYNYEIKK